MGALEDLAAALAGQQIQGELAKHNSYADFSNLAGSLGMQAVQLGAQNPKQYGTGEVVGTALAGGLLQGLLGNLGEDYQAGQTAKFQDAFKASMLGQPVDNLGLPTSIFKSGMDQANIFRLKSALGQEEAQANFQNEIQKAITLEGIKGGSAERLKLLEKYLENPEKTKRALAALQGNESETPIASPSDDPSLETVQQLPQELQNEGLKELSVQKDKKKAFNFVDSQFSQAKQIGSLKALVPGTTSANEMNGIQNSLTTFVQNFLGREMSQVERSNFIQLLPDWNDSEAQIDKKKARFADLLDTFSKSTPVLDSTVKAGSPKGSSPIAEGGLNLPTQATKPNPGQFSSPSDYIAAVRAWERK